MEKIEIAGMALDINQILADHDGATHLEFAAAVVIILKEEYGTHCYPMFMDALKTGLEN